MTYPEPPYTYDDVRITYDEVCFYYDGDGYDTVCLAGPSTVVVHKSTGANTSSARRNRTKTKNRLPHLNIFIQSAILEVNEEKFSEPVKIHRFTGEDTPISIFINRVQLDTRMPYVSGEIKKIAEQVQDVNASVEFLQKIDEQSDDEIMANNLKTATQDVQVEVVEPWSHVKVQISLAEEKNTEVNVEATLIRKDEV